MRTLDDDELESMLEEAAERGAERALEKLTKQMYEEVGKKVVRKFCQALGACAIGAVLWAIQHGWFK